MSLREVALWVASRAGLFLPVIILGSNKRPRIPGSDPDGHGVRSATRDPGVINDWFDSYTNIGGVGVACDGVVCVDGDADPEVAYNRWRDEDWGCPPDYLPPTFEQNTPRGGFHAVYNLPDDLSLKPFTWDEDHPGIGPHVDIKTGAGSYFVIAPSVSGDSHYKATRVVKPVMCPEPLLHDLIVLCGLNRKTTPRLSAAGVPELSFDFATLAQPDVDDPEALVAVSCLAEKVATRQQPGRDAALNTGAYYAGPVVRSQKIRLATAVEMFVDASRSNGFVIDKDTQARGGEEFVRSRILRSMSEGAAREPEWIPPSALGPALRALAERRGE